MRWLLVGGLCVACTLPLAFGACGGTAVIDADDGTGGTSATGNPSGTGAQGAQGGAGAQGAAGPQTVVTSVNVTVTTITTGPPPPCGLMTNDPTCVDCAFGVCDEQLFDCCDADGCTALVSCVINNCAEAPDQQRCALQNCSDEVNEAIQSGGLQPAQDLGECLNACGCG